MSNDLRWLVMEGYVTEFSDGKLFAPPVMTPHAAKKAESGEEDHDPVDFPEAHPVAAAPSTSSAAPTPVPESVAQEVTPGAAETNQASPVEEPKPEAQA